MVRRGVLFVLAFAVGYRIAYVAVDTAGRAALRISGPGAPRLHAGDAAAAVRGRVADPVRGRLATARLAIDEGKQAARDKERELRAENHLRQSS